MYRFSKRPPWFSEFRKREMGGEKTLRGELLHALIRDAGLPPEQARALLNGMDIRGLEIDRVAIRVLELPDPDALRACNECSWAGKERFCGKDRTCPVCGDGTHLLR